MSTPAVSALIRQRKADGAFILTASHNPGGPKADFGIKYNMSNGGPAPEAVTDAIFAQTKTISEYKSVDFSSLDLEKIGTNSYGNIEIEIVDSVTHYVELMKQIFDFAVVKKFLQSNKDFKVLFDGMSGVTGPYARRIFVDELGLSDSVLLNCVPSETFNDGHPDPNLTYAHELVERVRKEKIAFGAASDGDGDRNMILGHDAFVNPSDSVAVIAAKAKSIPYFQKHGIKGLARSMPTSMALDRVAQKAGINYYEVPTGWKFFGNLMDADKLSLCGEESFGTGSNHIREKDGIWAILAWLNILAVETHKSKGSSIKQVLDDHYQTYGRNFFSRYDYEEVESAPATEMMNNLRSLVAKPDFIGTQHGSFTVAKCDDFEYTDPIDNSVSKRQGVRIIFADGSRIIFRLSGTGSQGATIRMYVEKYTSQPAEFSLEPSVALQEVISVALKISDLTKLTGRKEPTVIT